MEKTLFMSQLDTVKAPNLLRTTLGSCIGIVLYDKNQKLYGLAHIMLPSASGRDGPIGKYADTAIPELLKKMNIKSSSATGLVAKIAGGANMFEGVVKNQSTCLGDQNSQKVKEILSDLGITIISEDTGGNKGRQLVINTEEGKVYINKIGEQPKEL